MPVEFQDFSIQVKEALDEKAVQFLEEAASEIESAARRNSRVDTGQLKGSWSHQVDEAAKEATVGSPEQNAIWEEFGTGEHAAHGDGRKGGWSYKDDSGDWHHTKGKTPNRTLQKAFDSRKAAIIRMAKQIFKGLGS